MARRSMVMTLFAAAAWSGLPAVFAPVIAAAAEPTAADQEAAYTRTINERAAKIVATLGIDEEAKAARVQKLISEQYRALREIHDARDAKLREVAEGPGRDEKVASAWSNVARDLATLKLGEAHRRFVARLTVELTPEQLEGVKNAMTFGVLPITYEGYLKLLPALTEEQKREILANLIEARELAMDGGSSEEKHAIFGKYKGRINNYLSSQGYDLKAAEKALAAKKAER